MKSPQAAVNVQLLDSALLVWTSIVEALKTSGFEQAGPEYQKLAEMLVQENRKQPVLMRSVAMNKKWQDLAERAEQAAALMRPLLAACERLQELQVRNAGTSFRARTAAPVAPPSRTARPSRPVRSGRLHG